MTSMPISVPYPSTKAAGVVAAVVGLAVGVAAGAGVVAAGDEVGAAVVPAHDGVQQGFPRPGHAHRQGQQVQQVGVRRVVLDHLAIAAHPRVVIEVARLFTGPRSAGLPQLMAHGWTVHLETPVNGAFS